MQYVLLEGRLYFFRLVLHLPHCLFSSCIRLSQSRVLVLVFISHLLLIVFIVSFFLVDSVFFASLILPFVVS